MTVTFQNASITKIEIQIEFCRRVVRGMKRSAQAHHHHHNHHNRSLRSPQAPCSVPRSQTRHRHRDGHLSPAVPDIRSPPLYPPLHQARHHKHHHSRKHRRKLQHGNHDARSRRRGRPTTGSTTVGALDDGTAARTGPAVEVAAAAADDCADFTVAAKGGVGAQLAGGAPGDGEVGGGPGEDPVDVLVHRGLDQGV